MLKNIILLAGLTCSTAFSANLFAENITPLPLKQRAEVIDDLLQKRVQQLLPELMQQNDIDMWVLISREYNEDPVLRTFLTSDWLSARRRTILVIHNPGNGEKLETLAIARYDVGKVFKSAWNPELQPDQWQRLTEIITERNPDTIAINQSKDFAQADGVTATDKALFMAVLPDNLKNKIVSAEPLAVSWLEKRIKAELPYYRNAVKLAHQIIAEGFSSKVVSVGETTTEDLQWWFRERAAEENLPVWFHPSVSVQRVDDPQPGHPRSTGITIQPGDLLHVDFGITYLRLNTDTQQHAYVLKEGESDAPAPLKQALANANQLQDILTKQFKEKHSGNDILLAALEEARGKGLEPMIYTHPIGYYGHGSGPTIGMWDKQHAIPGGGEYPLFSNTAYSIELNNKTTFEDKGITIMLEEDAFFDGDGVSYLNGRQESFHLID
ncbi:M24 family metallopeptidase [Idiomarina loihiensis]|uniref:M24 family metallopeptidase n=1 Tax=Idiomarina TaxID=135575 RepID=UPI0002EF9BCE|nr:MULTISPECIES: M24 family metallopeptidase [unclassified Idiomarina]NWO02908.1 M24 family metallopeptidase [Idiomarinaceae bacterium]TDO53702.1 Xaa-Pro aminopeptidase [Idiomarina sp. 017G]